VFIFTHFKDVTWIWYNAVSFWTAVDVGVLQNRCNVRINPACYEIGNKFREINIFAVNKGASFVFFILATSINITCVWETNDRSKFQWFNASRYLSSTIASSYSVIFTYCRGIKSFPIEVWRTYCSFADKSYFCSISYARLISSLKC